MPHQVPVFVTSQFRRPLVCFFLSNILLDDLPALVDANSSDTSRNCDDDYGVPELVELEDEDTVDSTHDESEVRSKTIC